jgi:peptidoglycan hydrolase-like protein with peptidoglycan-binding domain
MLERGSRGPDVERLQRELNRALGTSLPITGVFGQQTEDSLKEFQRLNDLIQDGKVGPLTHCTLFSSSYEFSTDRPPVIQQERFTCWAAALESALRSTWSAGRDQLRVADFLSRYSRFIQQRGDITVQGFDQVSRDLRTFGAIVPANQFRLEPLLAELGRNKSQVVLVHDLTGSIAHTVVIYGVRIEQGLPSLRVMDPLIGNYSEIDVSVLRGFASSLILVSTHRLGS